MTGAGVILAGGRSQRMGRPKALLPYGASNFVRVVLGHLESLELPWLGLVSTPGLPFSFGGIRLILNREPERGQLHSLRLALQAGGDRFPWLLVALVDQPAVARETYHSLAQATATPAHLWVPRHGERRGHPVIFSQDCYEDILAAPEEEGLRWVVARHRDRRLEVPVQDEEVLQDVDTPEDYQAMLGRMGLA